MEFRLQVVVCDVVCPVIIATTYSLRARVYVPLSHVLQAFGSHVNIELHNVKFSLPVGFERWCVKFGYTGLCKLVTLEVFKNLCEKESWWDKFVEGLCKVLYGIPLGKAECRILARDPDGSRREGYKEPDVGAETAETKKPVRKRIRYFDTESETHNKEFCDDANERYTRTKEMEEVRELRFWGPKFALQKHLRALSEYYCSKVEELQLKIELERRSGFCLGNVAEGDNTEDNDGEKIQVKSCR